MSTTSPAPPPFSDVPDPRMTTMSKDYKGAKPGESDRPSQDSLKKPQS